MFYGASPPELIANNQDIKFVFRLRKAGNRTLDTKNSIFGISLDQQGCRKNNLPPEGGFPFGGRFG